MNIGSGVKVAAHFPLKAEESAWGKKYGVQRPSAVIFLNTSKREVLGFNCTEFVKVQHRRTTAHYT